MKFPVQLSAIGLWLAAFILPLPANPWQLKNGKSISGDPLSFTEHEVYFRDSASFRSIKVDLSDLSAEALQKLKVWRETPANWKISIKAKQVMLSREKVKQRDNQGPERSTREDINETWLWEIEIKNETAFAVPAFDLQYTQFTQRKISQLEGKFREDSERPFPGDIKVPALPAKSTKTLKTKPCPVSNSKSEGSTLDQQRGTRSKREIQEELVSLNLKMIYRQMPFMTWSAGNHAALGIVPVKSIRIIEVVPVKPVDPLDPKRLIVPPGN